MDAEVKTALVDTLPDCDICKQEGRKEPADYDCKTVFGPWANLCEKHYQKFGAKPLGLGRGQKLILRGSAKQPAEKLSRADALCRRCGKGCPETCWNMETGRYRILDNPAKIEVMLQLGLYCEEV